MKKSIIISQAQSGNHQAFEQLCKQYNGLVRRTVKSLVKDSCDAEEIMAIVLVKLYQKINKYTTSISFEAWLKTVAINCCIDFFRRKSKEVKRTVSIDSQEFYTLCSTELNGEEDMANQHLHEELEKAIRNLPKRKRRVIELYYFENKSYAEIAKLLATPEGTIKSDLSRAKQKLKSQLQTFHS